MKKRYLALALAAVLAVCAAGCGKEEAKDDSNKTAEKGTVDTTEILQAQMPEEGEEIAVITTSKGVVKMRFFPEEAPKAVENFKTLAKKGYYNGLLFHRVIEDFMVQTGDPKGDGTGGESCWGEAFEDEISPKLHYYRGAVAMANSGANTNGSQFFIVQAKDVVEEALTALRDARDNNKGEELATRLRGCTKDSLTVSRCGTKPLRHRCAMPPPGLRHPASASLSLASCWPLPQQLLPVSAAGGGRRRC